ncbi:pre-tape measure chaperone protein [Mesorhizobium phage Cp1R7A-A1]|nr:pre-tape measure chaperone protein [Mesorhizobium phage Cp1R7A-A1]
MAKFSDIYAYDKTASEEGVWSPVGGGIKVKVRSFDSAHTRALRKKLNEPYAALLRLGKEIPEDDQNEIFKKLIAQSSLIDWNLTEGTGEIGPDGKEIERKIPFTPETAEKFFDEEPQFLRDVIAVLTSNETFKKRAREADVKNS